MKRMDSDERRALARCVAILPEFSTKSLDSMAVELSRQLAKQGIKADMEFDPDDGPQPTFRVIGLPKPRNPKRIA